MDLNGILRCKSKMPIKVSTVKTKAHTSEEEKKFMTLAIGNTNQLLELSKRWRGIV